MSLAFPPVGWHSTVEQPPQMTTVWACEKTVVIVKQPGHLTSMKKERGTGTRVWVLAGLAGGFVEAMALLHCADCGVVGGGGVDGGDWEYTLSLCFLDSAAGVGLSRSTARTCGCLLAVWRNGPEGQWERYHFGGCSCALYSEFVIFWSVEGLGLRIERSYRWKKTVS